MLRIASIDTEGRPYLQCSLPEELAIHVGDLCIAEIKGLQEFGPVVALEEAGGEGRDEPPGRVLRRATLQDQAKADENKLFSKMALETCSQVAEKYGLAIRLVHARYSFDRGVLRVRFAAEEKLDCREMTKDLVAQLRTRVQMEQIGVRDEAGIIGGLGSCGRELCCCSWLRRFESINVKMAKTQGLSLNPGSISGCCGRLKCCLRYEYDLYRELGRRLPRQGASVACPEGRGKVVGVDVLAQSVKVRLGDERIATYDASEVRSTQGRRRKEGRSNHEDPGGQRSEPEVARKEGAGRVRKHDTRRDSDAGKGKGT